MRAVVQRVHAARVEVNGEVVGEVGRGLVAFVGAQTGDDERDLELITRKIHELRVFTDDAGKMSRSVDAVGGGVLVVSQFTLLGDVSRGNRPSFTAAMAPSEAAPMIERLVARLTERGAKVATGRFGADMRVVVDNDGPVTIWLDSRDR